MKIFINKWLLILGCSLVQLHATDVTGLQLLDSTHVEQGLTALVAQADTNKSIPAQKARLEQLKTEATVFFAAHSKDLGLLSFSYGNNSYIKLLESLKSLAAPNKVIKAHHIRALVRRAKQLSKDLLEYITYVRSEGHTAEETKSLEDLKNLCDLLVVGFFKEEYFLPGTPVEIFKDLLLHRTTEKMMEHKAVTAAVAILAWELLGRKFDSKHEKSYSRPLSTVKNTVHDLIWEKPNPVNPNPVNSEPTISESEGTDPEKSKSSSSSSSSDTEPGKPEKPGKTPTEKEKKKIEEEKKKRDDNDFRKGIIRDKHDAIILLKPGQVGAIIAGDPLRLKAINPAVKKSETEDGQRTWAVQEQKAAHIVTLGELTPDILQKVDVPLQPDGHSCGPRSLWAARALLQGEAIANSEDAVNSVKLAYGYVDEDNARTLLGDELDSVIANSTKSLVLALDGKERDGVRSGGLKDQCKGYEKKLAVIKKSLEKDTARLEAIKAVPAEEFTQKVETLKKACNEAKEKLAEPAKKVAAQKEKVTKATKAIADLKKQIKAATDKKNKELLKKQLKTREEELVELKKEATKAQAVVTPLEKEKNKCDVALKAVENEQPTLEKKVATLLKEEEDLAGKIERMQARILKLTEKKEAIEAAAGQDNPFEPLLIAQDTNRFIVLEALTGGELIRQEVDRGMLTQHIRAFQDKELSQVFVLNYGKGHWIAVKLELVADENGGKKPRCTTYDSVGSSHEDNEVLRALLFLFTKGTDYQIGEEEIPAEYVYAGELEELYPDEAWAQEAKKAYLAQNAAQ